VDALHRHGLPLRDESGHRLSDEELRNRIEAWLTQMKRDRIRHKDGRPISDEEFAKIDLVTSTSITFGSSRATLTPQQLQTTLFLYRVMGLYNPFQFFMRGAPAFEFKLAAPGPVIETNGMLTATNQVRWSFGPELLFPDGHAMTARAVELNIEGQRKSLGRVIVADAAGAVELIELVSDDENLLRGVCEAYRRGSVDEMIPMPYGKRRRLNELLSRSTPVSDRQQQD
jgi:hypothetical protein